MGAQCVIVNPCISQVPQVPPGTSTLSLSSVLATNLRFLLRKPPSAKLATLPIPEVFYRNTNKQSLNTKITNRSGDLYHAFKKGRDATAMNIDHGNILAISSCPWLTLPSVCGLVLVTHQMYF